MKLRKEENLQVLKASTPISDVEPCLITSTSTHMLQHYTRQSATGLDRGSIQCYVTCRGQSYTMHRVTDCWHTNTTTALNCSWREVVKLGLCKLIIQGADKSLARPGRKQARKHVRDARDFNNIQTRVVIKAPKEIQAILIETLACVLPGRSKDLSAPYKRDIFVMWKTFYSFALLSVTTGWPT